MSRDPRLGSIMKPIGLHKYLYADGNPVDRVDPSGRGSILETGDIDLVIDQRSLPALAEVVGGTAQQVAAWVNAINGGIAEISAELSEAASEAGPAAWNSITSAVQDFNALMEEESLMGGVTRALVCADLGLVVGQIVDTASEKPWLEHTVEITEAVGCTIALDVK